MNRKNSKPLKNSGERCECNKLRENILDCYDSNLPLVRRKKYKTKRIYWQPSFADRHCSLYWASLMCALGVFWQGHLLRTSGLLTTNYLRDLNGLSKRMRYRYLSTAGTSLEKALDPIRLGTNSKYSYIHVYFVLIFY